MSVPPSRSEAADRLASDTLDALVVGGGIVGAGVARDAAMRGLRVGLVEQHDLAFGTSSRSSRLLHGGLRYLAQGRIGLVREASVEKRILHRIAPHLAAPLAFIFPTYRGTSWPLWQLRIGVKLYDLLCGGRNLGPSCSMTAAEVQEHVPGINRKDLTGAVRYYDGLTNDARLVIDTLRSAAAHGAVVLNYTRLQDAVSRANSQGSSATPVWQCELHDVLADRPYQAIVRTVVNATGPWAASLRQSGVRLRLTKGVHLVVDRQRLPVPDAVVIAEGRRILFAIPWGDRVILGTTDTDFNSLPEAAATEPADVAHILEVVNRSFPGAHLGPEDVISTWAGVRPMIASGRGGPSDISRAHEIRMPEPGWIDVAGGKLTTYRLIAEQVVDRITRYLGCRARPCGTAAEPLLEPSQAGPSGILPAPVERHAVEHFCASEWAVHLDDVMRRRTSWHYYSDSREEVSQQVVSWMANLLGWDASRQDTELRCWRAAPS